MQEELPFSIQSNLVELDRKRRELSASVLAFNTLAGYQHDWKLFTDWCVKFTRCSRPASADTVSLFLTAQLTGGLKIASARRRLSAITYYHQLAGIELPGRFHAVQLLRSAQRQRIERPRRSRPLQITELREISDLLRSQEQSSRASDKVRAIRDRAVLLLGFASALRRSSIVALTLDDLEFTSEGVILTIVREKQDQEAKGRYVAIPNGKHENTCAVRALRNWLAIRPESSNRQVFLCLAQGRRHNGLNPEGIAEIVKRGVALIGRDPRHYSGHSLRSGLITAAGEQGLSALLIAEQSGHRSLDVLRTYMRRTNVFRANTCAALDL
jgi:site-specific recombinase XerD